MVEEYDNCIIYDGDCPFCRRFYTMIQIRKMRPDIRLIDAREHPGIVTRLRADGIEINEEFILILDGVRYSGSAAFSKILELTNEKQNTPIGVIARPGIARVLYPVLVKLRVLLLRIMGRPLIP